VLDEIRTPLTLGIGSGYLAKSSGYTVTTADRGKLIECTGTFTLTFPTVASAKAGFSFWVRVVSGTLTLDGDGSEQINGAATYAISNAGDVVLITCTGTAWVLGHCQLPASVAITGGTINNTTIGATTATTVRATTVTATDTSAASMTTPGGYTSTVATGTAPFTATSTTACPNLNASLLLGATWAAPGTIGSGTPNTGAFTTLTASTSFVAGTDPTGSETVRVGGDLRLGGATGASLHLYSSGDSKAYRWQYDSSNTRANFTEAGVADRIIVANGANGLITLKGTGGLTTEGRIVVSAGNCTLSASGAAFIAPADGAFNIGSGGTGGFYNSGSIYGPSSGTFTVSTGNASNLLFAINGSTKVTIAASDGAATFASTTASTSTTTGALICSGGAGFAKQIAAAGFIQNIVTKVTGDSPYTVLATDYTILADTSGGSITCTLPAAPPAGTIYHFKKTAAANTLTIGRNGNSIDGAAADLAITASLESATLQYHGTYGWARL